MKKLISLLLVLVLVVAMAAPAIALSSTGTTKSGSGEFVDVNGSTYTYSYSAFASTLKAISSLSYGRSATRISVKVDVTMSTPLGVKYKSGSNTGNEAVSVTVTRNLEVNGATMIGTITKADTDFLITSETVEDVSIP